MKIEFTFEEVQDILLAHANKMCPGADFNYVWPRYGFVPPVVVERRERRELPSADGRAGEE